MKKSFALFIVIALLISALAAPSAAPAADGKLKVVCTIFPEYDWVKRIIGAKADEAEITLLLDSGIDLHSYQPTADDIIKVSTCDMLVYAGGESDAWVDDALKEAVNKNMVVIDLLDELGSAVKEEEVVEGMEHEHDHETHEAHEDHDHEAHEDHDHEAHEDHDHEAHEDHDHEAHEDHDHEAPEYDEHVWLSLKNAAALCGRICDKLCAVDGKNAAEYKANTEKYVAELRALDEQYQQTVDSAKRKTLLFADRFPFRYMTDDYGLKYYAAFAGCSAETEASFETIAFLSGKVNELGLSHVLIIDGAQHKIADTVIQNTNDKNQRILTLDSMQSTTLRKATDGVTYLSVMKSNLDVLKTALN